MTWTEIAYLIGGGAVAGVVNTLAGGGSVLSVPLLVLVGLPGNLANGTNRLGIFFQNAVAAWRFRAEGVSGFRSSLPVLAPVAIGSLAGALVISRVSDVLFERLFGVVMVLLLIPMMRRPAPARVAAPARVDAGWGASALFFAIGIYGGAFQAGVGIALIYALSYTGYDLVRANSIKVVVNTVLTATALPVFALNGQIAWLPAAVLAIGFSLGAALAVRLAVVGGERAIRPVLALGVVLLAGKMMGLY